MLRDKYSSASSARIWVQGPVERELAGVPEHGRAVVFDVVVEPNATVSPGQDIRQGGLSDFERIAAEYIEMNREGLDVVSPR